MYLAPSRLARTISTDLSSMIGLAVGLHGRHPVAEEDVDVLVLQRGVGDRHRQDLGRRLVAEASRTREVTAVVAVMSVQPTSEKRTVLQDRLGRRGGAGGEAGGQQGGDRNQRAHGASLFVLSAAGLRHATPSLGRG